MKNNFTIFDDIKNDRKSAESILKFNIKDKEYLIYTIKNSDDNTRILLLSNLCKQENGKYSITDITVDEKNSLSSIVYEIIMSLPFKSNKAANELLNSFINEKNINLSLVLPELSDEKYFANSLIAKVNIDVIEKAIDFYHIYLDKKEEVMPQEINKSVDTWTIPGSQDVIPSLDNENVNKEMQTNMDDLNIPNPQAEKLAVMYDPSINSNINMQHNIMRTNDKGNANTKYIVVGTVCIVLALAVVAVAYVMINNLK